ncbi:MAG: ABC transporter substrate-binding protein, partial [Actinobacteria bacterium]|nr:ABC transporter substrate-binding protein [Actinomycetota bacterium]
MYRPTLTLRASAVTALAATAALALAACGSSPSNPLSGSSAKGTVVVGSANFPEDQLLAEIYTLALKAKGVKVTDKFNIGAREVYYPQIKKGVVSILPEYNGSLLTGPVDPKSTASSTSEVNAALKAELPSTLEILNSSAATDSDSITVSQAFATAHNLTSSSSIGDLAPLASSMVLGAPPEFKTRSDGIAGLKKNYGLTFKTFDPLDESGPITIKALQDGTVQAADIFTTTPQIATDHFVTLADPKFNFAAQNVTPLVYKAAMTPTITSTLNAISAKLTTSTLLQLDTAVSVNH